MSHTFAQSYTARHYAVPRDRNDPRLPGTTTSPTTAWPGLDSVRSTENEAEPLQKPIKDDIVDYSPTEEQDIGPIPTIPLPEGPAPTDIDELQDRISMLKTHRDQLVRRSAELSRRSRQSGGVVHSPLPSESPRQVFQRPTISTGEVAVSLGMDEIASDRDTILANLQKLREDQKQNLSRIEGLYYGSDWPPMPSRPSPPTATVGRVQHVPRSGVHVWVGDDEPQASPKPVSPHRGRTVEVTATRRRAPSPDGPIALRASSDNRLVRDNGKRRISISLGESNDYYAEASRNVQKDEPEPEPEHRRSSITGSLLRWRMGNKRKITIPRPFGFEEREKMRPMTIAQRRYEEEVEERRREEEKHLNTRFRAVPVPATSIIPMYTNIINKNEERRREVRQQSRELTQSMERPFSFHRREKPVKQSDNHVITPKFSAKPIPPEVTAPLYATMEMRERERKERKEFMSRERERMRKEKERKKQEEEEQRKRDEVKAQYKPVRRKSIPDFSKLQNEFEDRLARVKNSKSTTQPNAFELAETMRDSHDFRVEKRVVEEKVGPVVERTVARADGPPRLTRAVEMRQKALEDKKRKEKEDEEEAAMDLRRRAEIRRRAGGRMVGKLHDRSLDFEHRNKERHMEFIAMQKRNEDDYKQRLEEMQRRIDERPFLFEQPVYESEKKKAEETFQRTLEDAGFDVAMYLDEAELGFG